MCYCDATELRQEIAHQGAVQGTRRATGNYEICRCPQCGHIVAAVVTPWHACPMCSTDDKLVLMVTEVIKWPIDALTK